MNSKALNSLLILSLIVILTIEISIFGKLFPWTGLQAIIVIPMIYGICLVTSIIGILITKKQNSKIRILSWIFLFILNTLIAASMYPQEFRPTVLKQIGYTIQVVKNFDKITMDDLKLFQETEFYPYDKSVPNDRERYVAALIKYKNEIQRDGSEFMYGKKNKPILVDTDIKSNLETGQDKLMWWLLD